MGRLIQLEIENFKSYVGHQIIGPFKDFTAVIGPNGSGKSNLMDAISFVLGVQSRHLRSQQLKDLVFREDVNAPSRRKAMVKLVYRLNEGEVDDSRDGDEIHFQRVISASGTSSYMLNNVQATWEEYDQVLKKIGVLTKARNFLVFQGDVESVASKSATELTTYFEQISGSDVYRREYDEAKAKMDDAENQTIFSFQKRKGYQAERRQAQDEKAEAEAYGAKRAELEDRRAQYFLVQLFHLRRGMREHEGRAQEHRAEVDAAAKLEEVAARALKDKKKAAAARQTAAQEAEKAAEAARRRRDDAAPAAVRAAEEAKALRRRRKALAKEQAQAAEEQVAAEGRAEGLRREIAELDEREAVLEEEARAAGAKRGVELDPARAEEYQALKAEARAQTAGPRRELEGLRRAAGADQTARERRETERTTYANQIELDEKRLGEYIERKQNMAAAAAAAAEARRGLERELKELHLKAKHAEARCQQIDTELEEVNLKLRDAKDDHRQSKREQKMTESIETLKRLFPGVRGRLGDLCKPSNRKYNLAVTVAGGRLMEAVVVDRQRTALECVQYLRDQRVGTATFLPLDTLKVKPLEERLRALGPGYRLCADVLQCADAVRPAVLFAVGSAVVCDDLDGARNLCFNRNEKVKAVTLSGAVISKAGLMTGGTTSADLDKASRWDAREFEALARRREALLAERRDAALDVRGRSRQGELETQIGGLKNKERYSTADMEYTENKIAEQTRSTEQLRQKIKEIDAEQERIKADSEGFESKISALERSIEEAEAALFRPFSAAVGVADAREYERTHLAAVLELNRRRAALQDRRAKLQSQLDYEESRDPGKAGKKLAKKLEQADAKITALERRREELREGTEALERAVAEAEEAHQRERGRAEEADSELRVLQQEKEKASKEKAKIGRKAASEEIQLDRLRSKLHDVLQQARVDQVDLSGTTKKRTRGGEEKDNDDDMMQIKLPESQMTMASETEADTLQVTQTTDNSDAQQQDDGASLMIDFSRLKNHRNIKSNEHLEEILQKYVEEMSAIQAECEKMQPNMKAFEKFDNLTDRLKDSGKDFSNAKDNAQASALAFNKIKEKRHTAFMQCFNHIKDTLNSTYRDLTKSSKHPLGGTAYLTLDDPEEPYLAGVKFNAMPPMKRFRDMEQLSGGERTVASLALLFSVHSFRPAPFFVMDEIDAALDNINVKKVCNYIKRRSGDCQSIVISLKDMFYERADSLVGVCRDRATMGSRSLTLDLGQYDG